MKESFIYRAGSSAANDNKNIVKLREDIFQLNNNFDKTGKFQFMMNI